MKKNLIAVVAALLAVVGLIFGILSFVKVQKQSARIDELEAQNKVLTGNIEDIADNLNLEIDTSADGSKVNMADMEPIAVSFGAQQNYNLKSDGSGKDHFANMKGYTLYLDKNADEFSDVETTLKADHAQIDGVISSVISGHTYEEAEPQTIVKESLKKINKLLGAKVAVDLVLDGYVKQ